MMAPLLLVGRVSMPSEHWNDVIREYINIILRVSSTEAAYLILLYKGYDAQLNLEFRVFCHIKKTGISRTYIIWF